MSEMGFSLPKLSAPKINLPTIKLPNVAVPKLAAPKINIPKINIPQLKASDLPKIQNITDVKKLAAMIVPPKREEPKPAVVVAPPVSTAVVNPTVTQVVQPKAITPDEPKNKTTVVATAAPVVLKKAKTKGVDFPLLNGEEGEMGYSVAGRFKRNWRRQQLHGEMGRTSYYPHEDYADFDDNFEDDNFDHPPVRNTKKIFQPKKAKPAVKPNMKSVYTVPAEKGKYILLSGEEEMGWAMPRLMKPRTSNVIQPPTSSQPSPKKHPIKKGFHPMFRHFSGHEDEMGFDDGMGFDFSSLVSDLKAQVNTELAKAKTNLTTQAQAELGKAVANTANKILATPQIKDAMVAQGKEAAVQNIAQNIATQITEKSAQTVATVKKYSTPILVGGGALGLLLVWKMFGPKRKAA